VKRLRSANPEKIRHVDGDLLQSGRNKQISRQATFIHATFALLFELAMHRLKKLLFMKLPKYWWKSFVRNVHID
jgi:hypothetical protein